MREAIVTLSDAELELLGFEGLVTQLRDAGVREVELLEDHGRSCVPQVTVEGALDLDDLVGLDCVDHAELVAEKDDAYVYLLELTATGLPDDTDAAHEALIGNCDTVVTKYGILVSLVGSQEAIRDMIRRYEATGASPSLRRLAEYDGGSSSLDALTERQLTVIRTAYDMGFYEIPREASTDDVAAALDLDSATVSEHLQRAERNLLSQQLPT